MQTKINKKCFKIPNYGYFYEAIMQSPVDF